MRETLRFYLSAAVLMLLLPAGAVLTAGGSAASGPTVQNEDKAAGSSVPAAKDYRVLRTETGKTETVSVRDYLIGAVAAEMPASYEPEALKAQAVVSHTYAERLRLQGQRHPDAALCGADFSDDSAHYQAFFSKAQIQLAYGAHYSDFYAKIAAAVDAAGDLLLYADGEPIVAAFHAVSSGTTEASEAVWGNALPYLIPVDSVWDRSAPHFEEERTMSAETVKKALTAQFPSIRLPENPAEWFELTDVSEVGTVRTLRCGSETMTGQTLRELLALRSACFTVAVRGDGFVFTTHGYGHNVGMSQYGANEMARSGADCAGILAHYYPGTELRRGAPAGIDLKLSGSEGKTLCQSSPEKPN